MLESLRRKKREKAAFARFLVGLATGIGTITEENAAVLLVEYEEELHQFKYNYKYVPVEQRLSAIQTDERDEESDLLDKVSRLTVSDKDA